MHGQREQPLVGLGRLAAPDVRRATPLATRYLPLALATLMLLLCCLLASCYLQLATRHLPATRYVALLWAEGHERGLYETVGNENSTQAHLMKSSA